MKKYTALICARGGSKGFPRKNLAILDGDPLVGHSILAARQNRRIGRVLVSTDCAQIASAASDYGGEIPFLRSSDLATDDAKEWDVWLDAIRWLEQEGDLPDGLVVLPPTAPLRAQEDVDSSIDLFEKRGCDATICVTPSHRNPSFNMVTIDDNSVARIVLNFGKIYRRQDAENCFDITTVCYVVKPEFIMSAKHLFDGVVLGNIIPSIRSVDIDNVVDLQWASFLRNYNHRNDDIRFYE